ncbi:uncharacterized protein LOC127251504 [Andrographis paniculata]|uniref:uncharacterized protein LOC127251504 n=1 Tax=Andrographis paniculata TaxID=175694 RepID=UPI0021E9233A|nr:uncharacterized protein LOC127251504 [Andrographis paniculata]XP_051131183.1 uncharacterized protein LOC127251504 [Andrographis paniculata]
MTRQQIILRSPAADRRQPLLENMESSSGGSLKKGYPRIVEKSNSYPPQGSNRRARLAEVAGGTTAECAAVACCCPCGLVHLFVLAAFKLPAGLCRKALRRRRRRRQIQNAGLLAPPRKCSCDDSVMMHIHPVSNPAAMVNAIDSDNSEVIELEKEMWDRFYGAGFWRSPSQRSDISVQSK